MPKTPDFDQIARQLLLGYGLSTLETEVAEQLRLVWNARGAADIVQLESSLSSQMGSTAAGPYVKNLDRALRTLDR